MRRRLHSKILRQMSSSTMASGTTMYTAVRLAELEDSTLVCSAPPPAPLLELLDDAPPMPASSPVLLSGKPCVALDELAPPRGGAVGVPPGLPAAVLLLLLLEEGGLAAAEEETTGGSGSALEDWCGSSAGAVDDGSGAAEEASGAVLDSSIGAVDDSSNGAVEDSGAVEEGAGSPAALLLSAAPVESGSGSGSMQQTTSGGNLGSSGRRTTGGSTSTGTPMTCTGCTCSCVGAKEEKRTLREEGRVGGTTLGSIGAAAAELSFIWLRCIRLYL